MEISQNPEELKFTETGTERIEDILERFDFNTVRDIVGELLSKSGVTEERAEKLSPELFMISNDKNVLLRIYNKYLNSTKGSYKQHIDKIEINSEGLSHYEEKMVVLAIIHEMVHSVSDMFLKKRYGAYLEQRLGLAHDKLELGGLGIVRTVSKNRILNEGITELVAEAVSDEYFRRKGDQQSKTEDYDNFYIVAKTIVEVLIKSITKKTNIPEDIVFKAFVRCMLNYDYDEFYELVKEDKDLLDLLNKIKEINSEGQLVSINLLKREASVELSKLKVSGLEDVVDRVIERNSYYNPLYGCLHL